MILFLLYALMAACALILWFEFQNAARIRRELDMELAKVESRPAVRAKSLPVYDGELRLVSSETAGR